MPPQTGQSPWSMFTVLPTVVEDVDFVLGKSMKDLVLKHPVWKTLAPRRRESNYSFLACGVRRVLRFIPWQSELVVPKTRTRVFFDPELPLGLFGSGLLEVHYQGDSLQATHPDVLGVRRSVCVRAGDSLTLCHLFGRACGALSLMPLVHWLMTGGSSTCTLVDLMGRRTTLQVEHPTAVLRHNGVLYYASAELSTALPTFLEGG